jgi:hypothetical protein
MVERKRELLEQRIANADHILASPDADRASA